MRQHFAPVQGSSLHFLQHALWHVRLPGPGWEQPGSPVPSSAQQSDSSARTESSSQLQWMTAPCPPNTDGWLVAVKKRAVRWWGGLSAWQQLCLGAWKNCSLLTSNIAYFIPFSFSIVLHLDCFVLNQFLLRNWVEISQELMVPSSCHCRYRCHWDTIAARMLE